MSENNWFMEIELLCTWKFGRHALEMLEVLSKCFTQLPLFNNSINYYYEKKIYCGKSVIAVSRVLTGHLHDGVISIQPTEFFSVLFSDVT